MSAPLSRALHVVSGGAGFIGSHVVDALRRRGAPVIVLDASGPGGRLAHRLEDPGLRWVEGDAASPWGPQIAGARALLGAPPLRAVIHLAVEASAAASFAAPAEDARAGLLSTLAAIEAAADDDARLVFGSSAAVYGDGPPAAADAAPWPRSPLGIHKLAAEMHLRSAARERGVRAIALRIFNAYGPRQDAEGPRAGVVARFLGRALAGLPLEVAGDGLQTRDFVFVDDVAQGILAACAGGPVDGSAIDLGSGREHGILELAERVLAVTRARAPIVHGPARAGEARRSCADLGRAAALLDFAPRIGLDAGLARTAACLRGGPEGV